MKEIIKDIHNEVIKQLAGYTGYKPLIDGETIVIDTMGKVGRNGEVMYPQRIRSGVNLWGDTQYRPQITPSRFTKIIKEAVKIVEAELAIKIKTQIVKEEFKMGSRPCLNCIAKFELSTYIKRLKEAKNG